MVHDRRTIEIRYGLTNPQRFEYCNNRLPKRDSIRIGRQAPPEVWFRILLIAAGGRNGKRAVAYVFIIMEIHSRRIVHVNVTTNPTLPWVKTQIRQSTPWDMTPRFLIHDNDGIFGQCGRKLTVEANDRKRSYRCHFDRWLDEVMAIKGIPIPYGAPNASPHVERFIRTLRQEALDYFIFLGIDHIHHVVGEYIRCYNGARPSQAIHGIPAPC